LIFSLFLKCLDIRISFKLGFKQSIFVAFNEKLINIMDKQNINNVLNQSEKAFKKYSQKSGKQKALFLRTIAEEIENLGDKLLETANRETNLPLPRLTGERGRTTGQLRLYAAQVEEGSWVDAIIDTAIPDRQPLPKVDLRKMNVPLGPVVVFGSSNFPFAYSTAGGDTASALASGCPVIVKCHPAHPETSRMVAGAILKAAQKTGMPDGVFAHMEGGNEVGTYLVKHPIVKAVGFTGSFSGGKALFDLANKRKVPIPVFAEMGSINPVFVFENALVLRGGKIAEQLADSVTLGVGQFCTKPGLIIGIESDALNSFTKELQSKMQPKPAAPMLHQGIANNFRKGLQSIENQNISEFKVYKNEAKDNSGYAVVGVTDGATFLKNKALHQEVFGPFTLVVKCKNKGDMKRVAEKLEGQLTASLMAEPTDLKGNKDLLQAISEKCGRFNLNNVPTGVEVTYAMQHGGPFPSSTDSRYGSVGHSAIYRWVRPLTYQNFEDAFLPDELKNGNPLSISRRVNGELSKEKL
jgi:2,5-dioxopentanoate dehydrogenase